MIYVNLELCSEYALTNSFPTMSATFLPSSILDEKIFFELCTKVPFTFKILHFPLTVLLVMTALIVMMMMVMYEASFGHPLYTSIDP